MKWNISFFSEKVMNSLFKWPAGIKAKFTHIAEMIEEHGPAEVGLPFVKALGSGLYEIRAKGKEGIGRAFFCAVVGKEIIILHSFIKKTQTTPQKELELARKRLKEVKDEQKKT